MIYFSINMICINNNILDKINLEQANSFLKRVDVKTKDECRNYMWCRWKDWYWKVKNNWFWLAHRLSYYLHNWFINDDLLIRHMCHNPSCCNPSHLEEWTKKDNSEDMIKAKRSKWNYFHLDWIYETFAWHCKRYWKSKQCVLHRLSIWMTLQDSLTKETKRVVKLDWIEDTISWHCRRYCISTSTIRDRMYKQWMKIEQAFNSKI